MFERPSKVGCGGGGGDNGQQVAASFKGFLRLLLPPARNSYLTLVSPLERNCKQLAVFNEVVAAAAARGKDGAGVCQEDIVWLRIIKHPKFFFFFSVASQFFFPPVVPSFGLAADSWDALELQVLAKSCFEQAFGFAALCRGCRGSSAWR